MKKLFYAISALLWLLRFTLGASLFSFAAAVARRLPRGEGVIFERSRCFSCGRVLHPAELIPCFSYLIQRGRCKGCGGKIPVRDFWLEVVGGVGACAAVLRWGGGTARTALVFLVLTLLAIVALIDYDTMEIFDHFHIFLLLCGAVAIWIFPEIGLTARLIGCVTLSGPLLIVAVLIPGGFGGGDIKLTFALGFLLGWKGMLCAGFLSIFSAGFWCFWKLLRKRAKRKDQIAFAPFICAGAGVSLFYGNEIVDWWLGLAR